MEPTEEMVRVMWQYVAADNTTLDEVRRGLRAVLDIRDRDMQRREAQHLKPRRVAEERSK